VSTLKCREFLRDCRETDQNVTINSMYKRDEHIHINWMPNSLNELTKTLAIVFEIYVSLSFIQI
jgi:hypothetical protein